MDFSIPISIIIGYFLGSIPTAYILLKLVKGIDIRNEGSGNVGTLNSFEVTNSKKIGITVLIIDLLKGILSVIIIKAFYGEQFLLPFLALLSAVFGHCYSIWLKFKGGRGLATAAGGALFISPIILLLAIVFWLIFYKWKKDIHLANIASAILIIFTVIIFGVQLNNLSLPPAETSFIFGFFLSLLMLIILSKHWEPLLNLLKKDS